MFSQDRLSLWALVAPYTHKPYIDVRGIESPNVVRI